MKFADRCQCPDKYLDACCPTKLLEHDFRVRAQERERIAKLLQSRCPDYGDYESCRSIHIGGMDTTPWCQWCVLADEVQDGE